jgi:hypothetical protein
MDKKQRVCDIFSQFVSSYPPVEGGIPPELDYTQKDLVLLSSRSSKVKAANEYRAWKKISETISIYQQTVEAFAANMDSFAKLSKKAEFAELNTAKSLTADIQRQLYPAYLCDVVTQIIKASGKKGPLVTELHTAMLSTIQRKDINWTTKTRELAAQIHNYRRVAEPFTALTDRFFSSKTLGTDLADCVINEQSAMRFLFADEHIPTPRPSPKFAQNQ